MTEEQKLWTYLDQHGALFAWPVWQEVKDTLPMPNAGVGPDGELLYTWDKGAHHYEIEVFPDGRKEYFYMHRQTGGTHEGAPETVARFFQT